MYKVFFNDHILCFLGRGKSLPKYNKYKVFDLELFAEFEELFPNHGFMKFVDNLLIVSSKPERLWNDFRQSIVLVRAAGGVVVNERDEFLFINRLGKWDLPKGKIENGEHVELAAVREVEEECGIIGPTIVKQLPSTYHLYYSPFIKDEDNLVLKETSWFEMKYTGNGNLVPQVEEDIEEARWISRRELPEVLGNTYNNLKELLEDYLP